MHVGHSHGGQANGGSVEQADLSNERRLRLVLGLTVAYMLAQVVGGLVANSLSLLADAGHMLADSVGLAMSLFALWFTRRPATPGKTYGFYRSEILAAFTNSLLLLVVAGWILYEAAARIQHPEEVHVLPMMLVAAGGLAVNLVGAYLLREPSTGSLNMRGAYLEVMADMLGSVGVLLAGVVILTTGWTLADPLVSVVVVVMIVPRAWKLLRGTIDILLEASPRDISMDAIEVAMRGVPGVRSVHDLHVWTISSGFVAMSGHVEAIDRPSSDVLHDLLHLLSEKFGIEHATLQVEQCDHPGGEIACCTLDPRCFVLEPTASLAPETAPHAH